MSLTKGCASSNHDFQIFSIAMCALLEHWFSCDLASAQICTTVLCSRQHIGQSDLRTPSFTHRSLLRAHLHNEVIAAPVALRSWSPLGLIDSSSEGNTLQRASVYMIFRLVPNPGQQPDPSVFEKILESDCVLKLLDSNTFVPGQGCRYPPLTRKPSF